MIDGDNAQRWSVCTVHISWFAGTGVASTRVDGTDHVRRAVALELRAVRLVHCRIEIGVSPGRLGLAVGPQGILNAGVVAACVGCWAGCYCARRGGDYDTGWRYSGASCELYRKWLSKI